jgi:hypothetical protein
MRGFSSSPAIFLHNNTVSLNLDILPPVHFSPCFVRIVNVFRFICWNQFYQFWFILTALWSTSLDSPHTPFHTMLWLFLKLSNHPADALNWSFPRDLATARASLRTIGPDMRMFFILHSWTTPTLPRWFPRCRLPLLFLIVFLKHFPPYTSKF